MKMLKTITPILLVGVVLVGCNSNEQTTEPTKIEGGKKIEHMHGLSYQDDTIFVATHEGMISTSDKGESWYTVSSHDNDFMGYHALSNGEMITSGHPGKSSNLPDPLGLLKSTDNGITWEEVSLQGKIDFHILDANYSNTDIIYGLNQMGSGKYGAGIFKSIDGGENWDKIEPVGLPDDLHKIYTLISLPNNDSELLAGTQNGVMRSEDSGETWELLDGNRLITAITVMPNESKDLVSYSITQDEAGIMKSSDNGQTWDYIGLDLGEVAVNNISINTDNNNLMSVTTFNNSVYVTEDGGGNWKQTIDAGTIK
ncbi:F510_1955 family glycosylhydrolase [Bacillus sp. SM2101]|uniref:F510_1955 family glycosylhydrolase n=1 Tax=Bacillus sp. SM2101 TaxID=2805366 RepID=UPI001BDE64D9|nr:hypothetical protein [Bacillus sp. SM2101]